MASLYELSTAFATIVDAYEAAETDEEREGFVQALIDLSGDIDTKSDAYAKIIRNVSAEAKAFRDEAGRLTKCAVARENFVERLKAAQLSAMLLTGKTEIKTSIGKWSVQKNPMSCDVTDPAKVPTRFHVPQPDKIDKQAMIREHKATGEIFEGAEFKQDQGLRFR